MALDATTPKKVRTDQGEVEAQSGQDQLAIQRYVDALAASTKKSRGLRFDKLILPGHVGDTDNNADATDR